MFEEEKGLENNLTSLRKESVPKAIVNLITDYIITKKLKPGDQLPTEIELMALFGVGRNSVREGIKMLVVMGVVEIRKGIGSFIVDSVSPAVLNPLIISLMFENGISMDLFELRVLLDTGIGDLLIEKATDEEIKSLYKINNRIKNLANNVDIFEKELKQLDQIFHNRMIEIIANPLVAKVAQTIYKLFFTAMGYSLIANPIQAYENHILVLDAIKNKDRAQLREAVKKSLVVWREYINGNNNP